MQKTKFLVIQTAFIGDAILATSILEKLHQHYPQSGIDFLVRKGNEALFKEHPFINHLYVWDKKGEKYTNLYSILRQVRKVNYDYVVNLQRFATTGLFAALSKGKEKIGFKKNPFSLFFDKKIVHEIGDGSHEIERNQLLIEHLTDIDFVRPQLYPSKQDFDSVTNYKTETYITISPASVWFTKQFPKEKWIEYLNFLDKSIKVYLLGGPGDEGLCNEIKNETTHPKINVLAGKLSFLESAAIMKDAAMNFTNDSAPLHIASSMNAPVTAIFCSTVPDFGFGPLSSNSRIAATRKKLDCRPCGLHGKKACPLDHFKCAKTIDIKTLKSDFN
ncbi:MAG: glycosyltransferase family 9 protein [Bacteroidales bacterium]|nr:glycosyltransferase family 9 protein [Bacteroidales bacterium]